MPANDAVALVTGASSGIGRETARVLAADGYRVVLAARRETELRETATEIESAGGEAAIRPTDITDRSQLAELVATTTDEHGGIDVLVNNAGVMETDPAHEADRDDWRQMIDVNLLGSMNLTREVLPEMHERGRGDIVFVSSVNARKSSASGSGYCASKAGINGFAESVRKEAAEESIRVSVIEPGMVATEMQPDELKADIPMLDPQEIAEAIRFVVSRPPSVSVNELLIRPTAQEF